MDQHKAVEKDLGLTAVATGSGLGFALLGVAPFTPPEPYMVGLFLAILQVRLAHAWGVRLLRAETRRHVLEVKLLEGSLDESSVSAVVELTCEGQLTRKLRLGPAADGRPSIADVLKKGRLFAFLDEGMGTVVEPEVLQALRDSELVILKEDVTAIPFPDESEKEAQATVQPLNKLDAAHLAKLEKQEAVSPELRQLAMQRSGRLSGMVILTAGFFAFLGGRLSAEKAAAEHTAPPQK